LLQYTEYICAITLLLINSTIQNLQGVRWRKFSTTWLNTILTIVNGGQGETTQQKKKNAVKYKSEQTFLKIVTETFSTDSPD